MTGPALACLRIRFCPTLKTLARRTDREFAGRAPKLPRLDPNSTAKVAFRGLHGYSKNGGSAVRRIRSVQRRRLRISAPLMRSCGRGSENADI